MKVQEPKPGMMCESTQGRDKGSCYVIMAVCEGGRSVLVADGRLKTVASPKTKNLKHVALMPVVAEEIAAKLKEGGKVYDHEVKKAIKDLRREREGK
ncbi:MAG: KOW domain-containing RNA-binding protein [Clostridia bacterium]|nr:KOW domain-containing RNA-binding protein [Clostridia bacterium]